MNARATEADRYRSKPPKAAPHKVCDTCRRPVIFIRNPQTRRAQICDVELQTVILESGEAVKGHVSHWATCPDADAWKAAKAGKAPAAPVKQPAARQLGLGERAPTTTEEVAIRIADATRWGWDPVVKRTVTEAVESPTHVAEFRIRVIDPYAESEAQQRKLRTQDLAVVERMRGLRVTLDGERIPLFVEGEPTYGPIGNGGGHTTEGLVIARLVLDPRVVAHWIEGQ